MPIRDITAATIIQILNCYTGFFLKEILQDTKLQSNIGLGKSLSEKTVALQGVNVRFIGCSAVLSLELEDWEVGFVDFAEAEGVGDEPFASFRLWRFSCKELFAPLPAVVEGEANGVLVVVGFKFFASKATSR